MRRRWPRERSRSKTRDLGVIWSRLQDIDAHALALHVGVATLQNDTSRTSVRAKLILQFVTQAQALEKHMKGEKP